MQKMQVHFWIVLPDTGSKGQQMHVLKQKFKHPQGYTKTRIPPSSLNAHMIQTHKCKNNFFPESIFENGNRSKIHFLLLFQK